MTKSLTRRILALVIGISVTATLIYQAVATGNEIASGALIAEGTMILGYYFGVKSTQL